MARTGILYRHLVVEVYGIRQEPRVYEGEANTRKGAT